MALPLDTGLKIGIQTIHREPDNQSGPWLPRIDDLVSFVETVDRAGFDSLWVGDHLSMPLPFFDPLLLLAQAAVVSRRLTFGTGVYLLPLRHPGPVAKQAATLDHLSEGRFIFGLGIGGEFPKEYEVAGVPIHERGPRLGESMQAMRALWSGQPGTFKGQYYRFEDVLMTPPPRQAGGPPLWVGGRKDAALRRMGRLADGYLSYVVTPDMYAAALAKIDTAAQEAGRTVAKFGTGHLLFARVDDSYEQALDVATDSLSKRYAMDFRKAAARYAGLGNPQQVAEAILKFHAAGVRHISVDLVGPYERRMEQIERFAAEVMPLVRKAVA
ncbi:MAG: LLM class flavin-dependent oxidoreductase [Alphaproteobacteria bacterium]|nr:LLM class flavin-dependent oxidoreductase [Alphaproteobacteria bacterium]MCB9931748.1 LLM class flavin-dependent oxidoreductase [Alphaproteobacteria bacterium]